MLNAGATLVVAAAPKPSSLNASPLVRRLSFQQVRLGIGLIGTICYAFPKNVPGFAVRTIWGTGWVPPRIASGLLARASVDVFDLALGW